MLPARDDTAAVARSPTGDPLGTSSEAPNAQFHFALMCREDPQAILRVLGLFAQRAIIPQQAWSRRTGDGILIGIDVVLENHAAAERLLHKLRSLAIVERANLVEGASDVTSQPGP